MNRRSFVAAALGGLAGLFVASKAKPAPALLGAKSKAASLDVAAFGHNVQYDYKWMGAQTGRFSMQAPNFTHSDFLALHPHVLQVVQEKNPWTQALDVRWVVVPLAGGETKWEPFRMKHLHRADLVWTKTLAAWGEGYEIIKNRYCQPDGSCIKGRVTSKQLRCAIANVIQCRANPDPFTT